MFDSALLNMILGLLFIYLLYSLLATIIQEIIATNLNLRGKTLRKSIRRMLDDGKSSKDLSKLFYGHPLIKYLSSGILHKNPSYLTGENFSKVVVDLLRGKDAKAGENFGPAIQKALDESKAQWATAKIDEATNSFLKSLWADSQGDVEKFKVSLEKWFDDTMEHSSGSYKRKTQFILFIIGLVLAVVFNLDTISITKKLSDNPAMTKQLVDNAELYMQTHRELSVQKTSLPNSIIQFIPDSATLSKLDTINIVVPKSHSETNIDSVQANIAKKSVRLIDSLNTMIKADISETNDLLGLGWKCPDSKHSQDICIKENFTWMSLVGWLITALAISMGAPFWFDLLTKFMKFRGVGRKPEDKQVQSTSENTANRVG